MFGFGTVFSECQREKGAGGSSRQRQELKTLSGVEFAKKKFPYITKRNDNEISNIFYFSLLLLENNFSYVLFFFLFVAGKKMLRVFIQQRRWICGAVEWSWNKMESFTSCKLSQQRCQVF